MPAGKRLYFDKHNHLIISLDVANPTNIIW